MKHDYLLIWSLIVNGNQFSYAQRQVQPWQYLWFPQEVLCADCNENQNLVVKKPMQNKHSICNTGSGNLWSKQFLVKLKDFKQHIHAMGNAA